MHVSVDTTRRQKAEKTGMGGYHVSFFFKEETCKGNLSLGNIVFLALNTLCSYTLNFPYMKKV